MTREVLRAPTAVSDKSAIDDSSPASAQSSTTSATRTSLGRAPSPSHQSAFHALVMTDEASPLDLRSTRNRLIPYGGLAVKVEAGSA